MMTSEKAIQLLHRLQDEQFDGVHGDERREALEMAVRALEGDGDTIYRKAAIDTVNHAIDCGWDCDIIHELNELPSAQPQACDDAISRDDAIMAVKTGALSAATIFGRTDEGATAYYETVKAIKALPSAQSETHDKRTETHECDLISRKQAIDAVVSAMIDGADAELVEGVMELLPSAQPERKKGEWEEIEVIPEAYDIAGVKTWASMMRCNQCGFTTFAIEGHFAQYDFCPSCGADMRTEGKDDN